MGNNLLQPLSKWQLLNLRTGHATFTLEPTITPGVDASTVLMGFIDETVVTVPHRGGRYVQVSIYNTDYYKMPELRIESVYYGYDETDSDNPFYYVTITFHQPESGVVRITI